MATLLESHGAEWTPADLDLLPDHWKVELLDGTLIVNAQPMPKHQLAAQRLLRILADALGEQFEVFHEIMLDLDTAQFAPDLTVTHRDRIEWEAKAQAPSAVALVVEVASPSTRAIDRTIKAERYAEAGIPCYWRVELDPVTVIAYGLRDGSYVEAASWSAGQELSVDEPARVRFDPASLLP